MKVLKTRVPGVARRRLVLASLVMLPVTGLVVPAAGCQDAGMQDRQLVFRSQADATRELAALARAEPLSTTTAWNWAQTLTHGAQSIEYSMTGYPQARSALFQRTVGAAAFAVFAWRGRMTHDLGEAIPGAPTLVAGAAVEIALARLTKPVADFTVWTGPLHPHFAYGALDKDAFAHAHAMHLANHFSGFHQKV
jgi:hypothetical protein